MRDPRDDTARAQRPRDNTALAAELVEALVGCGVRHVVIAPGSRSTPLVAACARHDALTRTVVHDERSGAFVALGMARATGRAAALVVTSGTALANATPAVVEADCDRVPLVIVSADRPPEAQGTDANQTIDQLAFFGARVRGFENVLPPDEERDDVAARVAALLARAHGPVPGPVHVNAMFRKPLEPRPLVEPRGATASSSTKTLSRTSPSTARSPGVSLGEAAVGLDDAMRLVGRARAGVIVLGAAADIDEREGMARLAASAPWPVLAEALSSTRGDARADVVSHGALLLKAGFAPKTPDVVVWLGGALVSTELLDLVARAEHVIRVDARGRRPPERARAVTHVALPARALVELSSLLPRVDGSAWRSADAIAARVVASYRVRTDLALDEPFVAMEVSARARALGATLFVGNSMPVRDVELFAGRSTPVVVANRGASGIDGLISTAAGLARAGEAPVIALLGDVSFLHDAGALSALARMAPRLRIVVVENGGGRIFDFLPIAAHQDLLEPYFTTPHATDLVALARAHGIPAAWADSRAGLTRALAAPLSGVDVVVVDVRGRDNVADHRALSAAVSEALMSAGQEAP